MKQFNKLGKKVKEIYDGIINDIFKDEDVDDEARRRIFICLLPDSGEPHCRHYNPDGILGPKCDGCGCTLKFKSKSPKSKCPLGKWENKEEI